MRGLLRMGRRCTSNRGMQCTSDEGSGRKLEGRDDNTNP